MSEQQQLSLLLPPQPAPRGLPLRLRPQPERQQEQPERQQEQPVRTLEQQALRVLPVLRAVQHREVARVLVEVVAQRPAAGQR